MTNQPRFDLLNQMANFMDDLPSDRLHMPMWCGLDSTATTCGSAGCFAGWTVTRYARMGWIFRHQVPYFGKLEGAMAIAAFYQIPHMYASWIVYSDTGHGFEKFQAQWTKNLATWQTDYEVNFHKVTPRHVADRIRRVITKLGGEVVQDYPVAVPEEARV